MPVGSSSIDFAGYDQRGEVVLLAEVKGRPDTSMEWAAQLRRNILAHGALPRTRFFLIAALDRIYVWKDRNAVAEELPPDFVMSTESVLAPYTQRLGWPVSQTSPEAFKLVVLSWLNDLAGRPVAELALDPVLACLSKSGFLSSIQNARIEFQPG